MRFVGEGGIKAFTICLVSKSYVRDHIAINDSTLGVSTNAIKTPKDEVLDDW